MTVHMPVILSTWDSEEERLQVQSLLRLHSKTVSKKIKITISKLS